MDDQKNLLLAIVLTGIVLLVWQYMFGLPQLQQKQVPPQQQTQQQPPAAGGQKSAPPQPAPGTSAQQPAPGTPPPGPEQPKAAPVLTREDALKASPRVPIETERLAGSIALMGGRIDDLSLTQYRETVDPKSPPIVLLAPSGSPNPFYAEFGWTGAAGTPGKLPGPDTLWKQEGSEPLSVGHPVTLVYDNGEGLQFRRTISVDDHYLFTIQDSVTNSGTAPVTLYPYGLVSRQGTPPTSGYAVLHEGPIGVMGDKCLRQSGFSLYTECHEESYKTLEDRKELNFDVTNTWFGFTDKYWGAVLIPDTDARVHAKFSFTSGEPKRYQADYLMAPQTIAPGGMGSVEGRVFAGAKEVATVYAYNDALHLNHFDLMIDWGRFYLITQPMFWSIDHIYRYVGNFGVAILIITVIIKGMLFWFANKSYASMAKMKALAPELAAIKTRYADDKVKFQQATMELYRKEKINPAAGCWPLLVQFPFFFSLYKVLVSTIEMRHAPFFGWIQDLSAPDPTNVFNLFGLLPFDPTLVFGSFLHVGVWPLMMGITQFLSMKLNPPPPDPSQQVVFNWMPVIFTFMMANFAAGLVIYWTWNNILTLAQQSYIMQKHGAKIELWNNLKGMFIRKKPSG
jgi:YidC/Oxa1 family membrane protein insertase